AEAGVAARRVVVDDVDTGGVTHRAAALGSPTWTLRPLSGLRSARIVPPCAATMDRLMDSPMPSPDVLVVTNGLKMLSRSSSLTPTPVSRTHTSTLFGVRSAVS